MYAGVCFVLLLTFILGNLLKVWWNGTQTSNGTWTKYGSVINSNRHSLQETRNCIISSLRDMYSVHIQCTHSVHIVYIYSLLGMLKKYVPQS